MSARPEDTRPPTANRLKADIDGGRTGDKVPAGDPAMAPLGTDAEAAGTPPTDTELALAARHEGGRFGGTAPSHKPDRELDRSAVFIVVGIAVVAAIAFIGVGYYLH